MLPGFADTYFAVKQLAAMKSREPLSSLFCSAVKVGRYWPLVALSDSALQAPRTAAVLLLRIFDTLLGPDGQVQCRKHLLFASKFVRARDQRIGWLLDLLRGTGQHEF
jgi:hypothetical protein